ncbi:LOW QUALITY PROTEIN: uncharacterized protein gprin3b [Spinachia spinachia]
MGTNPKRTVSVQMVPHMAAVDTLGNKEPNANWAKEPNLQLQSQVCPKPTFISPEHQEDNSPSTNTTAHTDNTAPEGGQPVSRSVTDKPAATNANQTKSELVTRRDQQVQDPCPTCPGAGETGGDQKDSNANMKTLSTPDKKDVCKAAVGSKVNMQKNDCRIKGPNAAEERSAKLTPSTAARGDGNKNVAPGGTHLHNACELKHAIPGPQRDNRVSALKDEHAAVPQGSQEPDHVRSSVSPQEEAARDQSTGSPAAPPGSAAPSCKSNAAKDAFTRTSSSSTHPHKDPPPLKKPQVSSDRQQPVSSQTDSSAAPQATQTAPAGGRAAEEASQTDAAALEAQRRQRDKLYREASTMTASPSPARVKRCHDMEVQAVANTCSKAVATSPSLLPFAAPRRPSGGAEPREAAQSLVVVHQVGGGVGLHQVDASSPRPAATEQRSERLTVEAEMCPDQNASAVFHSETLSQQQDKRLGAKPKDPGSALCNTQPVYQINIEHSHLKEAGETGNLQSETGVQKQLGAAKAATAQAPPLGSGTLPETAGAPKPGSADSHNAALEQAATKPSQAPPTTTTRAAAATNNTSKTGPPKNKSESPKQKAKGGGQAQKKAAKSGKEKMEPEGKEKEDQKEMDIHDVVWDEQGMTWEVYGASVDPESLGFAIQSHLQCKIKEQERKMVSQTSFRKSVPAVDSPGPGGTKSKRRRQNIFRSMLQNVRRPNCCVRPPPPPSSSSTAPTEPVSNCVAAVAMHEGDDAPPVSLLTGTL